MDLVRRADGVAHVMQAVEHRHELVAVAVVGACRRGLEPNPVGHARLLGAAAGGLDRPLVIVGPDERGVRERFRHQDRR